MMQSNDKANRIGTLKPIHLNMNKKPPATKRGNTRPIPKTTTTAAPPPARSSSLSSSDDDDSDDQGSKIEEIGQPIIKSPLDAHGYKIVKSVKNNLKGLLVSTCDHSQKNKGKPSRKTCIFEKISKFNETHVNFKSTTAKDGENDSGGDKESHKFTKASKQQERESRDKRKKANDTPKCRKGDHEVDDAMQTFCNTMFACVLYIKVGSHQDPQNLQGLAHLVEHVMSLGSENYPEPEAFSKFCEEQGGGFSNAETQPDNTIFYFFINHELIADALEMFGDMIANPVFQKPELDKEIENLNSEFEQKKWFEELHRNAILQSCIKDDNHPANCFGWGTKESLKMKGGTKELIKEIHKWIKTFYFSENMFFGLQGPLPLAELENLFANFAKKIPGKKDGCIIARPLACGVRTKKVELPFDMAKWNRMYYMDVSQRSSFMTVSWALDPKFGNNYETKPLSYFRYILSHKEPGSLDWYLKQKGWIFSMNINTPDSAFFYSDYFVIYSIYLELKSDGLAQRMEVLKAVFQYIKLLQENKASEEIFNEFRQLRADTFHYRSDNNICDPTIGRTFDRFYATETLRNILHVMSKTGTTEDILLSTFLTRKFDAGILNEFAKCLQPSKALVIFGDHSFGESATETDKWFPFKYFSRPIPSHFLMEVHNQRPIQELCFPKQNPFLLVSFCYPDEHSSKDKMEKMDGLLAYQSDKGEVIYGNSKCQKGILPSAEYIIEFASPALEDDAGLMTVPCMEILALLLHDVLEVKLGRALSSLISFDVNEGVGAVQVTLYGPSPKLPRLAQTILKTVENFDEEIKHHSKAFEDCKRMQIGYYKSDLDEGEPCSSKLLEYLIIPRLYFTSDYIAILEDSLDLDDFLDFVSDFKRRMYVAGDLNGCVSKRHADDLAQLVDSFLCKPYKKKMEHEISQQAIQLPVGERCLRVLAKNKKDKNSTVRNYYQFGHLNKQEKNMLRTIAGFLNICAFEELRTKQGLGYNPEAGALTIGGIPGIYVFLQGVADENTCGYIDEKMDEFLQTAFDNNLSSNKKFEEKVLLWNYYDDVKLDYKETKRFYMDHLLPSGNSFRKLSIQVQGHPKSKSQPKLAENSIKKIQKYSSGEKLIRCANGPTCGVSKYTTYIDMDFRGIVEENGYFITNVKTFKDGRSCFPVFDPVDSSDDDDDDL